VEAPSREEQNWAGSHTYRGRVVRPRSVQELQDLVATQERVRALGSRHSFTDIADTDGVLVSLEELPLALQVDEHRRTVTVGAGTTFHALSQHVHAAGWALPTMASLPHISVAGAVATGTHGSGRRVQALASMVRALELVRADGEVHRVERGGPDFAGSVVALGALGVVTTLELELVPTFDLWQQVWLELRWDTVAADPLAVLGSGYSVSLFTSWAGTAIEQVWVKGLADRPSPDLDAAHQAGTTVHPIPGMSTEAVTEQLGVVGPWHERLPHFRATFTPSSGVELQSEYLVPIARAAEAIGGLRGLADLVAPLLQVSEIRTVAADDLWLSGAFGTDVVALHFTWHRDWDGVHAVLPEIERLLLPLGARPHWGKCFVATGSDMAGAYPMLDRFKELRDRTDPARTFGNAFLDRVL